MKKIILSLAIAASSHYAYAQNTYPWPSSNAVGIGTTSPGARLDVVSVGDVASKVFAWNNSATQRSIASYVYSSGSGNSVFPGSIKPSNLASNEFGFILSNYGWNEPGASRFRITIAGTDNTNGSPYTATGYSDVFTVTNTGNVGIGTTNPTTPLDLRFPFSKTDNTAIRYSLSLGSNDPTNPSVLNFVHSGGVSQSLRHWEIQTSEQGVVDAGSLNLQAYGGNVGIGTTDPHGYKLAVNGSAIATSMTVKLYNNWPDYVFKKDYKLPSLLEVKSFIDKNSHLPDMPSEQEVKDNGINLGEMVKLQTKKIEELTLYAIEQQKRIADLEQRKADRKMQEERIAALEKALLRLTKNKKQ